MILLYVKIVVMIFSILSSLNYAVYFLASRRKWREIFKNNEIKAFFKIMGIATVLIALSLRFSGTYDNIWHAVKDGLFQVVSFISTSGYFVCDYTTWPAFYNYNTDDPLIHRGGCSFSTSGSLKVMRVTVLF